jgi:anti-sigma factor RsiW
MITCQAFRSRLQPGTTDAEVLEHLRNCDACLDHAMAIDPDNFFRAIGGEEMEPPGGVDAFASGVMAQIRMRKTEGSVARRFLIAPRRLAAAAVIILAVGISFFASQTSFQSDPVPRATAVRPVVQFATKPVVETYDSKDATIVEMPTEGKNDPQVVMIFDESLPADL